MLGHIFAAAVAVCLVIAIWAWAFTNRAEAEFIRNTAILISLLFGLALGVVENWERKRRA